MLDPAADAGPILDSFQHDILGWARGEPGVRLSASYHPEGYTFRFYFDDQQQLERQDSFRRYGTDSHGLAKIMARIPSHERLFRQIGLVSQAARERVPEAAR
jgi:hypothetical protein